MARRRVNKRLSLILVSGLIVLLGCGWGLWQGRMRQRDPQPYMIMGDQLFAEGQYRKAMSQYRRANRWAGRREDTDTQITALVKISSCLPRMDVERAVGQALGVLDQAVTIDPKSIEVNKARLEMKYETIQDFRNSSWLKQWKDLQQYADTLIELIGSEKKLDKDNARAHYLRGFATLRLVEMQRDMRPEDLFKATKEALPFFTKAHEYHPSFPDYCKALAQTHIAIAAQISIMDSPSPEEDRQLVLEHWYQAEKIVKQFREQNPTSAAAWVLLADRLYQVRSWSARDQRDEVAENPQVGSGLDDYELLDVYLKAWADDSARPTLTELDSALERLMEGYLQEAQTLGTDILAVQLTKAAYWEHPTRRDLAKVRASLEKAAEHDPDIISKLWLYVRIARAHQQDGQNRQALKVCEEALAIPVDLRIVRTGILRSRIHSLHQLAAQILLKLTTEVEGTDQKALEEFNALLDRVEEHLKGSLAIVEARKPGWRVLLTRGKIAQLRRPRTRQGNRRAIQSYEQARDELESMSTIVQRQNTIQYVTLLTSLAQTYEADGQPGAAQESLSKGIETLRIVYSRAQKPAPINPSILLYLASLQLKNRHADKAQQTLDEVIERLSKSTEQSDEQQAKLRAGALRLRVLQFKLQNKPQEALARAQEVEELYPELAEWAIARQLEILGSDPAANSLEMEAILKRWMALRPDSSAPVNLLAELYTRIGQPEKAQALRQTAIAENPEFEEILSGAITPQTTDPKERLQMLKEQLEKNTDDPLQRHVGLFQLYRREVLYYKAQAIKYAKEGDTESAQEAQKQAIQNNELALQSLAQAYEIRPDEPKIHETLFAYYLNRADWEKAEKLLARAEEVDWDGVGGLYFRGRLHNKKGQTLAAQNQDAANEQYQEALKSLEEAVRQREKFYQAWAEKARVENRLGRYEAALVSARTAVRQNPTSNVAVRMLLDMVAGQWLRAKAADDQIEAKKFAEETDALATQALELDPRYRRAKLFKNAYMDEYDTDRAIKERLARLKEDPSDRTNLRGLLQIYRIERKAEQARQVLMTLIAKEPDSSELLLFLAQNYIRNKQYAQALQVLEPAEKQWPDRLAVIGMLAETYRLNNKPNEATACLQRFLSRAKDEKKAQAYQILGVIEAQLGRRDNAVRAFQQAVANVKQYRPDDLRTVCDLSGLIFRSGARRAAIVIVLPLAEKDDPYALRMLVDFYRRNAELEKSIKWAQRGVSLFPESLEHKTTLALALLAGNKPAEVQELLENVVKQVGSSPGAADAYVILAGAHIRQRQYEEAIQTLEQAIVAKVNQPKVRVELAILYRFEGRIDEAGGQYQRILEKYPGNRMVRQSLASLWKVQGRYNQAEMVLEKGREIEPDEYLWSEQLSSLWLNRPDKPNKLRSDKALEYALEANTKSGNSPSSLAEVMKILNLRAQFDRSVDFYERTVPEAHKYEYRILTVLADAERGRWQRGSSGLTGPRNQPMSTAELEQLKRRTVELYYQVLGKAGGDADTYVSAMGGLKVILGLDGFIKSIEIRASENPGQAHNRIVLAMLLDHRAQKRMANDQEVLAKADRSQALALLQAVVQQPNLSAQVQLMAQRQLATVYTNLGMYEQAGNTYAKVLEVHPYDMMSLNNLAFILTDTLNKPEEALDYIERALQRNPQEPNLLDTYGWALFKAGQTDRAIEKLSRSVTILPSSMNNYHLGAALKEAREYRRALQALREAEKLLQNEAAYKDQIGPDIRALIEELEQE